MTTTTMIPLNMVDVNGPAHDAFGRRINYLRISLTDRCNLRCVYCMPAEGVRWQAKEELLTDDELLRVVRLAADVGFTKIRLTGGEPTLRRNLPDLIREIAANPAITDIAMTTNGILLSRLAEPLAQAGLKRINVSIDTLDPERFKQITRGGRLDLVMEGIQAAEAAGLT
ncbi:MAG TPA: radical SAM protein, partial [Thermomicrobiales bacterium]